MHFDVYDADSLFVARLDGALDKEVRLELNGTGSGKFSIPRGDPNAIASVLAEHYTVQVTVDEIDDEAALFEFYLTNGDFALISSSEEGGEDLSFSGKGTLSILGNAILDYQNFVSPPGSPNSSAYLDQAHGEWHFTHTTAGDIMRRFIFEAIERDVGAGGIGVLANVTRTFFDETDTDNVLWDPFLADWRAPIGANLYDEVMKLVAIGLIQIEMEPGFILNAYQTLGRDLSGGSFGTGVVRFAKGTNIVSELNHNRPETVYASDLLIKLADGTYARKDVGGSPLFKREMYVELQSSDTAIASSGGDHILGLREDAQTSLVFSHLVPNDGATDTAAGLYLPGPRTHGNGNYWLGDTISVYTGASEFDIDLALRVYGITLRETETGALDSPIVECGYSMSTDGLSLGPAPVVPRRTRLPTVVFEANSFDATAGSHDIVFDTLYQASDPFDVLTDPPSGLGLSLTGGGTTIEATQDGTWNFWVDLSPVSSNAGDVQFGHPMFHNNPRYALPRDTAFWFGGSIQFNYTVSMTTGETVLLRQSNAGAAACIDYCAVIATRLGDAQ